MVPQPQGALMYYGHVHNRVVEVRKERSLIIDPGARTFDWPVTQGMNAPSELREMAQRIRAAGTKPDLEVFELGHIEFGKQLIREGLVETPALFQVVLGVRWGAPATTSALNAMKDAVMGHHWSISDMGSGNPHRTITEGLLLGGSVRVGLEDSVYIEPGVLAKSNAQQVEQAVKQIGYLGFGVASPSEARIALGLNRS